MDANKKSEAKRAMPLYLGEVLMLTIVVYFALEAIELLPLPIDLCEGQVARHSTHKISKDGDATHCPLTYNPAR